MKNVFRFMMVLALLAASLMVVAAQDDVEIVIDPATSGVFTQDITSGTWVDNDDETFTLTINDVAEYTDWVFIAPNVDAGQFETLFLSNFWGAVDGLSATATLRTDNVTAVLTLTSPVLDLEANTLSYTATVDNIFFTDLDFALENDKATPELAAEFSDATLSIIADADFITGINEGEAVAQFRGPSSTSKSCSAPSSGNCNNLTSVGDLR